MRYKLTDLNNWPIRRNQEPIFKTSDEAILYAQLIYNLPEKQDLLDAYKHRTYKELRYLRDDKNPNFNRMMDLACRAQFFRECLEECERIKDENTNY